MVVRYGLRLIAAGFLAGASVPIVHAQSSGPAAVTARPGTSSDASDAAGMAEPSPADPVEAADLPALAVTSVEVLRTAGNPSVDIVYATGVLASNGWGAPQLVPTYAGQPFDDVLDLQLVATPPGHSEPAGGYVPVSAILALEPGHTFKGVRVRGSENAVSIDKLPGSAQAAAHLFDCKDCAGKHFVAAGQTKTGDQGMVREDELPKALRVIRPADGIKGAEQNPNRLTLMLGEDGTILQAFWE